MAKYGRVAANNIPIRANFRVPIGNFRRENDASSAGTSSHSRWGIDHQADADDRFVAAVSGQSSISRLSGHANEQRPVARSAHQIIDDNRIGVSRDTKNVDMQNDMWAGLDMDEIKKKKALSKLAVGSLANTIPFEKLHSMRQKQSVCTYKEISKVGAVIRHADPNRAAQKARAPSAQLSGSGLERGDTPIDRGSEVDVNSSATPVFANRYVTLNPPRSDSFQPAEEINEWECVDAGNAQPPAPGVSGMSGSGRSKRNYDRQKAPASTAEMRRGMHQKFGLESVDAKDKQDASEWFGVDNFEDVYNSRLEEALQPSKRKRLDNLVTQEPDATQVDIGETNAQGDEGKRRLIITIDESQRCWGCAHLRKDEAAVNVTVVNDILNYISQELFRVSMKELCINVHNMHESTIRQKALKRKEYCTPWMPDMIEEHLRNHVQDPHIFLHTLLSDYKFLQTEVKDRILIPDRDGNRAYLDRGALDCYRGLVSDTIKIYKLDPNKMLGANKTMEIDPTARNNLIGNNIKLARYSIRDKH
jgi:hypothetical protein